MRSEDLLKALASLRDEGVSRRSAAFRLSVLLEANVSLFPRLSPVKCGLVTVRIGPEIEKAIEVELRRLALRFSVGKLGFVLCPSSCIAVAFSTLKLALSGKCTGCLLARRRHFC